MKQFALIIFLMLPTMVLAQDHLFPEIGNFGPLSFARYEFEVRSILLRDVPFEYRFRAFVLPSFSAEWQVSIVPDSSNRYYLYASKTTKQIWELLTDSIKYAQLKNLPVQNSRLELSSALFREIDSVFVHALGRTRYSQSLSGAWGIDGTNFHFSMNDPPMSGMVWSPKKNSVTYHLVGIVNGLYSLATQESQSQALESIRDHIKKYWLTKQ